MFERDEGEGAADALGLLATAAARFRGFVRAGAKLRFVTGSEGVDGHGTTPAATAPQPAAIRALVDDDPIYPRLQAAPPFEPIDRVIDLQENVLRHIACFFRIAEEPRAEVEDHPLVKRH